MLALDLLVLAVVAGRGVEGLGGPVAVGAALTLAYLALTAALRRPHRPPIPAAPGVRILTVIPTRNNAGTVAQVVRACLAHTPDVLVVDDGSTDGSGALAEAAGARVLTHPRNRGKGAALESALDAAARGGFTHLVALDADGQHLPDDLPAFFAAVRARPDALIAGVRDMAQAPRGAVWARANSNFWVWAETGWWVGDTQCGFRAYPVGPIRALGLVPSRYQWEVEVLVRAAWAGVPVLDHPCQVIYPPAGERVSSYRKVVDTARITWLNAHLLAERALWPPRWFPASRDWRGGHRGGLWGWNLLLGLLKVLGPRATRALLVPLVAVYWLLLGAPNQGVDAYLRRRLPDTGPVHRSWLRFRLLLNFAWSLVDRFHALLAGTEALAIDRSAVPGLKESLYGEHAGRGLLLISGHLGNPDLGSAVLRDNQRRVHLLLHQDPQDPYLALLQRTLGPRAPAIIAVNDGAEHASLQALRALEAGDVVAVKGDRPVDGRTAEVRFLGGTIRLPTGPLLLGALSGAPVVFIGCFALPGGGYRIEAVGPRVLRFRSRATRTEDLQGWAQAWAEVLEGWTARHPLQWYNFFDPWAAAESPADSAASPPPPGKADAGPGL